jgi:hypothetical protein
MTLQAAVNFIEAIPERAELAAALDEARDYDALARIGRRAGFAFTAAELDVAFRLRCAMRERRRTAPDDGSSANG